VAEARRFISSRRNWFPRSTPAPRALPPWWVKRATPKPIWPNATASAPALPDHVMMGAIRRFDRHNQQLLLVDTLSPNTARFQAALQVAYQECRGDINALTREGGFASQTTSNLVRRALAGYVAAAILMPYDAFARAVEDRRYDIEAVARLFGTSFEQTAHRMTTLHKPGAEKVPFFLRLDAAGNISKRLDGAGFPFASHGGGCPLWNVHDCFAAPGRVHTQWLELPMASGFSRSRARSNQAAVPIARPASCAPSPLPAPPNTPRA
jgi:predicted transcriptional regulator